MKWDKPQKKVWDALTGPAVRIIGTILIIGGGLAIALTEGQGAKKFLWIIVGLGIALNVASIVGGSFASGALIETVNRSVSMMKRELRIGQRDFQ